MPFTAMLAATQIALKSSKTDQEMGVDRENGEDGSESTLHKSRGSANPNSRLICKSFATIFNFLLDLTRSFQVLRSESEH